MHSERKRTRRRKYIYIYIYIQSKWDVDEFVDTIRHIVIYSLKREREKNCANCRCFIISAVCKQTNAELNANEIYEKQKLCIKEVV